MEIIMNETLSEYKPYDETKLNFSKMPGAFTDAEKENMESFVNHILETYSLDEYMYARGGLGLISKKIENIIANAGVSFTQKNILEFGAGICKTSAVISKLYDVNKITCVDISEGLLKQLAPRVISMLGGDLSKFQFVIGDMNQITKFPTSFDAIVCYGAVHHLHLPEYFFANLQNILNPGGFILILDEPKIPSVPMIPKSPGKKYLNAHYAKRFKGDNENIYSVAQYCRIFGKNWKVKRLDTRRFSKILPYQPLKVFMSDFLLFEI